MNRGLFVLRWLPWLEYIKNKNHYEQVWKLRVKLAHFFSSNMLLESVILRRRRESSGRPKTKRRRRRKLQERRRMTTWSFAECVKMEESFCAVTPARRPTTSTASTRLSLRSQTGSGCVLAAWWAPLYSLYFTKDNLNFWKNCHFSYILHNLIC